MESKEQANNNADKKSDKIFCYSLFGTFALSFAIPTLLKTESPEGYTAKYAAGLLCSTIMLFPILGVYLYFNEKYQKKGYKNFIKDIPQNLAKDVRDYLLFKASTNGEQQLIENAFKEIFKV